MNDDARTYGTVEMVTDSDGSARLVAQDGDASEPVQVVLSDDQWAWMQGAMRQISSECLVLVIFLGISCGLAAWRIVSDGWH